MNEAKKLSEQGKQTKLQWLQHPSEINGNSLHMYDMKPQGTSGIKRGIICKTNSVTLQQTVRAGTPETSTVL
jgi:hypothetical protein